MNYFTKILQGCEDASYLALKHKEEPLPFRKMMEMKIHLLFCSCCTNFVKQAEKIDLSLSGFFQQVSEEPPFTAGGDFKAMLKEKLK